MRTSGGDHRSGGGGGDASYTFSPVDRGDTEGLPCVALRPIKLFTVNEYFGSLAEAQKVHFNDGGQFDKLYTPGK